MVIVKYLSYLLFKNRYVKKSNLQLHKSHSGKGLCKVLQDEVLYWDTMSMKMKTIFTGKFNKNAFGVVQKRRLYY